MPGNQAIMGALLAELKAGQAHVWRSDAAGIDGKRLRAFPEDERSGTAADPASSNTFSRAMLRGVLSMYLGYEPGDMAFTQGANGKPQLKRDPAGTIRFNVSHSGGTAVVAVVYDREVGVDIEAIRNDTSLLADVVSFFSPAEVSFLEAFPGESKAGEFYRLWSRKEAILKATGEGIGSLSPGLDVLRGDAIFRGGALWQIYDMAIFPGYASALAVEGERLPVIVMDWHRRPADVRS